jgi:hypothetical protein
VPNPQGSQLDDSASGTNITLRNARGGYLWRRVSAPDLPHLVGYEPFFTINPRSSAEINVEILIGGQDAFFEVAIDCRPLRDRQKYECGWVDPAGNRKILFYGDLLVV